MGVITFLHGAFGGREGRGGDMRVREEGWKDVRVFGIRRIGGEWQF